MNMYYKTALAGEEIERVLSLACLCEKEDSISLIESLNVPMMRNPEIGKGYYVWCEDGGNLIGFLGAYSMIDNGEVELAGMVLPSARRRGIMSEMLSILQKEANVKTYKKLLVVDQKSVSGIAFANQLGSNLLFSEYGLSAVLDRFEAIEKNKVAIKEAADSDIESISRVLQRSFGDSEEEVSALLARNVHSGEHQLYAIVYENKIIGTITASQEEDSVYLSAFAIDPDEQGKGYGRASLERILGKLGAEGIAKVKMDVETDNQNALSLYLSVGFQQNNVIAYYLV
ncbi:GNAT family N-acetyltransferase [Bacillus sp. 1P06AnD]|uniref:GNAT family N-acetyltransferase n=1 Tax=Bacillus sp. 1P06AnD TaxID=3132208 RepID=UPI00399F18BE